jgi:hypothetical protein
MSDLRRLKGQGLARWWVEGKAGLSEERVDSGGRRASALGTPLKDEKAAASWRRLADDGCG